jgi:glycosyltransferase involved in cell wall biosynthesis
LIIRGTGGDEEELRARVQSHGIADQVTFVPFLPFDELLQLYRSADIFVLPSRIEGQGRVLIEALASGCVVIGTDVGGIPAIVSHEENGLLIEPGSVAELSGAIQRVLSDDDLAERLITGGVQWAHEHTVQQETRRAIEAVVQIHMPE